MKLKITIAGQKVHDVGYRVFLLKHAMNTALPGLSAYNWEESGQRQVIALVEGDEARIEAFLKAIEKNKPELAEVSKVTSEPYEGDVWVDRLPLKSFFGISHFLYSIPAIADAGMERYP